MDHVPADEFDDLIEDDPDCPDCSGLGWVDCPICGDWINDDRDGWFCETCQDKGEVICDWCQGTGSLN